MLFLVNDQVCGGVTEVRLELGARDNFRAVPKSS